MRAVLAKLRPEDAILGEEYGPVRTDAEGRVTTYRYSADNRLLDLSLDGRTRVPAVHETLDARRLRAPWVQTLLPFRMPRRA